MRGRVWWQEIDNKGSFRLQQNVISLTFIKVSLGAYVDFYKKNTISVLCKFANSISVLP